MEMIEKILRDYTKKIPSIKNLTYWERLKSLKMNSEARRLERYKILYTWKIMEGLVPNPGINTVEGSLESRRGRQCQVPNTKDRDRMASFMVMGPKLFNSLPKDLRNMTNCSIDEFKSILDGFLGLVPDEPKSPGLTPGAIAANAIATNSLLYQIPRARRDGLLSDKDQSFGLWSQMTYLEPMW